MKRNLLIPALFFIIASSVSGQNFKSIKIGNQVWMAENLNVYVPGSWTYNDNPENGEKYGRLYTWDAALKACPPGWHLPTDKEWQTLIDNLGGEDIAGKQLKPGGTSGFNATLGGLTDVGNYRLLNTYGTYWTSSSYDTDHAWYIYITASTSLITKTYFRKNYGFSVRYVKNN
jgi:uncharacterized protein (TIGR02145 family)